MIKVAVGEKIGMTQIFQDTDLVPVSAIEICPNTVLDIKTKDKNGYSAIRVVYGKEKKKIKKTVLGQIKKAKTRQSKIKEFRLEETEGITLKPGDKIEAKIFQEGEKVAVQGFSKGRGFQGAIKRHGSHRGPETHGSHYHRRPGSLGASSFPSRVFKGKKMPGRMGGNKITVKNLEIIKVDAEKNLIFLKGAVPGSVGNFVIIKAKE